MRIERVHAPVRKQVEDALRNAILDGEFTAGQRLVERELCERLEVSRPLVREALRQLQAEMLVSHEPPGGMRVARIGAEEAEQLYEVRALLEPFAAARFVDNASAPQRRSLANTTTAIEESVRHGQRARAIRHKNLFYELLIAGCGNTVLEQTLRGLQNRTRLLRGVSMSEPGRLAHTAAEIRRIADAIARGDAHRAREASELHLTNARKTALEALARQHSNRSGPADTPNFRMR